MCPGVSAIINFLLGVEKYLYATSMVIPCSLSALSPSVRRAKSRFSMSSFVVAFLRSSSWSMKIPLESYNSLPIRVDFPSSTLPAVVNLRMSTELEIRNTLPFFYLP